MEFIQTHWLELTIIALFFIAIIIYLAWQIKKKGLKDTVVTMIVKAENMYNKGDNEEKINYVIDKIIALVPIPLQFFITREAIRKFIQKTFDEVKKALDYVPNK